MDVAELKVLLSAEISPLREGIRAGNEYLNSMAKTMETVTNSVSSSIGAVQKEIGSLSVSFSELSGATSRIASNITSGFSNISNATRDMGNSIKGSLDEAIQAIERTASSTESLTRQMRTQTGNITKGFSEISTAINAQREAISTSLGGMATEIGAMNEKASASFSSLVKVINSSAEMSIDALLGMDGNIQRVSSDVQSHTRAMSQEFKTLAQTLTGVEGKAVNLQDLARYVQATTGAVTKLRNSFNKDFDDTRFGKAIYKQTEIAMAGFENLQAEIEQTNKLLKKTFTELPSLINRGTPHVRSFAMSLRQAALDVFILRMNLQFMTDSLWGMVKPGVEFGATIENARLGMAGILTSMTQIDGKQTTFAQATGIADNLMKSIADNALLTTVTTEELLQTFQALLAPGLSAKMTLEQIVDLATTGANAVKAIGLPSNQVVQEMRDLIMGGIRPQSSTLAASLGITDADVKRWREAGTLYDELTKRMTGFKQASEETQNTFNGLWSNIKDGIQRSQANAFDPFFAHLKNELRSIQGLFYDIKKVPVTKKDKDGNETTEMKSIAIMNTKTEAFFTKLANIGVRIINIFKNIFTTLAPILVPLFNSLESLIVLFDGLLNALTPVLVIFTSLLGILVDVVNEGIKFLSEHILITIGILAYFTAGIIANASAITILNAIIGVSIFSHKAYALAVTACNIAVQALSGNLVPLITALGAVSVSTLLIAGAVVAVIAVLAGLYYAWDETVQVFKSGLDYMVYGLESWENKATIYFTEFILKFKNMVKDVKESWNDSPFGKTMGKFDIDNAGIAEVSGALDVLTGKQDELDAKMAGISQNFAINFDLATKKVKDGIYKSYQELKNKLIPDMPNVTGIPKGDEGSGKGANKLANAQEKLDMAEIEARRKAYVEDIKKYIKERDLAYEQGEISLREHLDFTYQAEKQIALIEYQALEEKLAVQKEKAEASRERGAEAEALKDEADAVKIASEMRSKLVEIETKELEYKNKLINAHKETLKTLYETITAYQELAGGASKYQIALEGINHADRIKKLDAIINEKVATEGLTQAEIDQLNVEKQLAREARDAENKKFDYDSKIKVMNDYKNEYDRVMAGVEATEAENNLLVKQGSMTEIEAQEQSIRLRKEANAELQTTVNKLDALMNSTKDPLILNQLRKLKAEIQGVGTELTGIAQQLKETLEDGITDAFTGIITGTKKVSQAFHELATSIFNDVTKYIVKGFAQTLVGNMGIGNWFGGGKKPQQGATTGLGRNANGAKGNVEANLLAPIINDMKLFGKTSKDNANILTEGLNLGKQDNLLSKATNILTDTQNAKDMELTTVLDMLKQSALDASSALSSLASSGSGGDGESGGGFNPIGMFSNIFRAEGGLVKGRGTGTSDDVPIWASNEEFIIKSAVVKKFGKGFFESLNNGYLPVAKFASGGLVGNSSSSGSSLSQTMPNIKIDIINQSGNPVDAKMGSMNFDGKQWVMQMFLSGLASNTMGSKDILKGMK